MANPYVLVATAATTSNTQENPILYRDEVDYIVAYNRATRTFYCVSRSTNVVIASAVLANALDNVIMGADGNVYYTRGSGSGHDFQPFCRMDPVTMTEEVIYGTAGLLYGPDKIEIAVDLCTFEIAGVPHVINLGLRHGVTVMKTSDLVPVGFSSDGGTGSTPTASMIVDKNSQPWIVSYKAGIAGYNLRKIDVFSGITYDVDSRPVYNNVYDYNLAAYIDQAPIAPLMFYEPSDDTVIIYGALGFTRKLIKVSVAAGTEGTVLSSFTIGSFGDLGANNDSFKDQGIAANGDFFLFGRADVLLPAGQFTRFNSGFISDATTVANAISYVFADWFTPTVNTVSTMVFDRSTNTFWVAANNELYHLLFPSEEVDNTIAAPAQIEEPCVEEGKLMLRWSDDGGKTWSSEHFASMGKVGEFKKRLIFRRLGKSRRRCYEAKVTDPVPVRMISMFIDTELEAD